MAGFEGFTLHEQEYESFEELRDEFEWYLPEEFNAGRFLCDRLVTEGNGGRPALIFEDETVDEEGSLTFRELRDASNRVANYLDSAGVSAGDRVVVNLPQKRETLVSHLAIWKLGAVSVPLSILYGPDALEYRLGDSRPIFAVVDAANLENFRDSADVAPIEQTLVVGDATPGEGEREFWEAVSSGDEQLSVRETAVTDPMLLMYSSGTTGPPKGIVQPHRSVLGHLPGAVTNFYNCKITDEDVMWTPSEWAWGASFSVMFAALSFGRPVVAHETGESFDPGVAFDLIDRHDITLPFVPPSALRMMMQAGTLPAGKLSSVRLVSSGGESLGSEVRSWAGDAFDADIHEVYGMTETFNLIVGDCTAYRSAEPGWMGVTLPGHTVEILDPETSEPVGPGEVGEIGVHRDDPTMFLEYWKQPEKTAGTFSGEWMLTGDLAERNESGRFRFYGRKDDLIISAGYRIGPEEIEDTLLTHDAVADAGVIGIPDESRGEVPKAYVVLESGVDESTGIADEVKDHVRENLAAYEYPRAVAFVDQLPRTTTGKIQRARLREREGLDR